MYSYTVVGYIFNADTYCPEDIFTAVYSKYGLEEPIVRFLRNTESDLHDLARQYLGIDPLNESSYDSDEFPKVIFADQCEDDRCCVCNERLIDNE